MLSKQLIKIVGLLLLSAGPLLAAPHELRIPLHDGRLRVGDLSAEVFEQIHLPAWHLRAGEINLNGWKGSLFLESLNASLSDGCRVNVDNDELVFHFDGEKLPHNYDDLRGAVRTFVATDNPEATAAQARHFGLFLPHQVDPARNLVILIHGMDCNINMLQPMGEMLTADGFQVGYFCYPGDAPIEESTRLLEKHLSAMRDVFPGMRIDFVAHSMGGLIARRYVEGAEYQNDVDRLIMVGTPNNGSKWSKYHLALKIQNQIEDARLDKDWHWTWFVTEGLGEASRDLTPHSRFLRRLNALPRRDDVKYTIVAGSHSAASSFEASWLETAAAWVPLRARDWYVLGPIRLGLQRKAHLLREQQGQSDGPVSIAETSLRGVKDVVVLPADHCSLFYGTADSPPASLDVVRARLRD